MCWASEPKAQVRLSIYDLNHMLGIQNAVPVFIHLFKWTKSPAVCSSPYLNYVLYFPVTKPTSVCLSILPETGWMFGLSAICLSCWICCLKPVLAVYTPNFCLSFCCASH